MSSLPSIVLVHGAWHTPPNYRSYVDALQKQGFEVHCPRLPTCSGVSPPTASLPEDIAYVREIIKSLVNNGQRVLMIFHSYGGAVGGSAVEGLSIAERKAAGKPGGVIHLLNLCGYLLRANTSVFDVIREAGYQDLVEDYMPTAPDGLCSVTDPATGFFSGRASQEIVDEALNAVVKFPIQAFHDVVTGYAWKTIPTTYIRTLQDGGVPTVYQDIMLGKAQEDGISLKVKTFDADHSLFITEQEEMVKAAVDAANDERNIL
ncbi:hypothetical protein N7478_008606 [Penicillium angulare]|uniref:uncharacterized protein n=1 Tax=Penicillium angulare TaxID=116970 RepID=UPI00254193AD|nr:uncharacterized protein N7478_008606 [Penicillium angulare]KAJ5273481.1 hypothetical protein N7478_008606 [Penicillium angulare]